MNKISVKRAAIEVFGGCNYRCQMCPQSTGRGTSWTRKMPLAHFENLLDQLEGYPLVQLEGSGEAFLAKDLDLYVKACSKRNMTTFIKTNGDFKIELLESVLDAGLNFIRFSLIGFDRLTYIQNMGIDRFEKVVENIMTCQKLVKEKQYNCQVSVYHLINDLEAKERELSEYIRLSEKLDNISSSVWKMHNWSGNINRHDRKIFFKKRSCGRPFADQITIRAGGEPGRLGAVTPCTQTLGPPNETKSVLGYSDKESLHEIFYGEKYETLRALHRAEKFDDIEYCKDCDFLYDDNEVLVWTNDPTTTIGQFQGTNYNLFKNKNDKISQFN